jgi:hypothetical protein
MRKVRNSAWTAAWVAPASTIGAGLITDLWLPELARYHMEFQMLTVMAITGLATWWVGYQTRERVPE